MQRFENRALTTFTSPPDIWKRYVDDTFAKLKITVIEEFLTHLNNQHPRIKFTTEVLDDQKIPFLDTLVAVEADGTISFNVYRKKTHTQTSTLTLGPTTTRSRKLVYTRTSSTAPHRTQSSRKKRTE